MFFNDVLLFVKLLLNISSISLSELLRITNESGFKTFVNTTFMNIQHSAHKPISDSTTDTVNSVVFEKFEIFIFIFFNIFFFFTFFIS